MQWPVTQETQSADENGDDQGLVSMGIGVPTMSGMMGNFQQPAQRPTQAQPALPERSAQAAPQKDPVAELGQMRELPDAGMVPQKEFDTLKKRLLGL